MVPLKKMAAPWPPRSRLTVTSLPGRRRLSGAVRDKQKEAPEGRSGRRRDRAAGAQGLPAGRPGAAGPGEWVGWGKERELSPLRIHSFTPPGSCSAPGAPGSPGSALWGQLLGASRSSSVLPASGLPQPPGLRGRTLSPVPRRASPLPGTPCLLALYIPGVSASAPQVPLSSLGFPHILTPPHTYSPLHRGSTSGLSLFQLFFVFNGSFLLGSRTPPSS